MRTDEISPLPEPEVERASFGDETKVMPTMQNFAFDEYGTRVAPMAAISVASEMTAPADGDPLARIERTLAATLATIDALHDRVASIESSLSEFLRR